MQKLLGAIVLLMSLTIGWYWMAYQNFLKAPLHLGEQGLVLLVEKGSNLKRLARDLKQQGVLSNDDYLYWHARWHQQADRIRAGEYLVPQGTTPPQLLALLISGKTISHTLTLLEGWTFEQVLAAVRNNEVLRHELDGMDAEQVMAHLGYPGVHPEGRFFPETYAFPRGTTDSEFLQRAYRMMEQQLAEAWTARNQERIMVKTPYEALILASIIEKETGVPDERPEIAGVFTRRLKRGMKLQTDPTVIYGMGDSYDGNIRRRDLLQDTPYNTYVHRGLPPTPICMPGREAIDAALDPLPGKSLYFVATGDGRHVFSATLEQHNAAVRKYQLKQ